MLLYLYFRQIFWRVDFMVAVNIDIHVVHGNCIYTIHGQEQRQYRFHDR